MGIFEKRATGVFDWPWKWSDKEQAEFTENLQQLRDFLQKLETQDLPLWRSGTGIAVKELNNILATIDALSAPQILPPASPGKPSLRELAETYIEERKKEPMFERVRQIRDVIESLQHHFF